MRSAIVLRVWHFFFIVAFYWSNDVVVVIVVAISAVAVAAAVAVDFHRIGSIRHLSLNTNGVRCCCCCLLDFSFMSLLLSTCVCVLVAIYIFVYFFSLRAIACVVCEIFVHRLTLKAIRIYNRVHRFLRFRLAQSLSNQHTYLNFYIFSQAAPLKVRLRRTIQYIWSHAFRF